MDKKHAFLYLLLMALAAAPLFYFSQPYLQDYPNHLARMFIILHQDDPVLSRFYEIHWSFLPNMASDLLIPLLGHIMPLTIAGKAYLLLTFAVLTSGALAVNYALYRRPSVLPFYSFLLLFGPSFMIGMLNYMLGIGLALHGLALWIRLADRKRLQLAYGFLVAFVIFIAHLYALAAYALFIALHENMPPHEKIRPLQADFWKRNIRAGLQFIPVIAVFVIFSPTSAAPLSKLVYTPIGAKIAAIFELIFFAYNPLLNIFWLYFLSAVMFFLCDKTIRTKIIYYIVIALGFYLVMPKIMMSAGNADWRVVVPFLFLIVASLNDKTNGQKQKLLTIILVLMMMLQVTALSFCWVKAERSHQDFLIISKQIPEGAILKTATIFKGEGSIYNDNQNGFAPIFLMHEASYAAITNKAFVVSLFSLGPQQPLDFKPPYDALRDNNLNEYTNYSVHKKDWSDMDWNGYIAPNFDYALIGAKEPSTVPESSMTLVIRQGLFLLYKSKKRP